MARLHVFLLSFSLHTCTINFIKYLSFVLLLFIDSNVLYCFFQKFLLSVSQLNLILTTISHTVNCLSVNQLFFQSISSKDLLIFAEALGKLIRSSGNYNHIQLLCGINLISSS